MSWRLHALPRLALAAGLAASIAIAPTWGGSSWGSALTAQKHHTVPKQHLGPLSGKWSGSYSGSFSGTFALTWKELGQKLTGTIEISAFSNVPTSLQGTVKDGSIRFGTVGSKAITYAGSVGTGSTSMSGTWTLTSAGQSAGSGSWKASKS